MSKTTRRIKTDDHQASRARRAARNDWQNWAEWSRDEQIAAAAPGLEAVRTSGTTDPQWAGFFAARSLAKAAAAEIRSAA